MTPARYDTIGVGYAQRRHADPRIAAQIHAALAGARRVVNVGAGAGSYEPESTLLVIEPSAVMIAQRPPGSAPAVQAVAEALPLPDSCADAALASLTVHHWTDPAGGLDELLRVAPSRTVVLCWDRAETAQYWLFRDYLPEIMEREAALPDSRWITAAFAERRREVRVTAVPVPRDCSDGTAAAYWARPASYLDGSVTAAMSGVAQLEPEIRERGLAQLRADLADGTWQRRNAEPAGLTELDCGFRLLVATPA